MKPVKFYAKVVYGFKSKLEVVLLGELKKGKIDAGMYLEVVLRGGTSIGKWEIKEVLKTDFINQYESESVIGIVVKCIDINNFELIKTLRVYDEYVFINKR